LLNCLNVSNYNVNLVFTSQTTWPTTLNLYSANFIGGAWVSLIQGIVAPHIWLCVCSFTTWSVNNVIDAQIHCECASSPSLLAVSGDTNAIFMQHCLVPLSLNSISGICDPHIELVELRKKNQLYLLNCPSNCLTFNWLRDPHLKFSRLFVESNIYFKGNAKEWL